MSEAEGYYWMFDKLAQKKESIALKIMKREHGFVECTDMVQQFLHFGMGCICVALHFGEITGDQYHASKRYITDSVAQLNKMICSYILHEYVPDVPGMDIYVCML